MEPAAYGVDINEGNLYITMGKVFAQADWRQFQFENAVFIGECSPIV
jgi:hypothetical protein